MKPWRRVEVQLLGTGGWRVVRLTAGPITPEESAAATHWLRAWVGPGVGFGAVENNKRKSLAPAMNSDSSFVQSVA
jgi:hypothetical protein